MAKEKNDKVKITLIKSLIGRTDAHRATVRFRPEETKSYC